MISGVIEIHLVYCYNPPQVDQIPVVKIPRLERKDYFSARATLEGLIENYPGNNQDIKTEAKQKFDKVNQLSGGAGIKRSDPKPGGLLELDERN